MANNFICEALLSHQPSCRRLSLDELFSTIWWLFHPTSVGGGIKRDLIRSNQEGHLMIQDPSSERLFSPWQLLLSMIRKHGWRTFRCYEGKWAKVNEKRCFCDAHRLRFSKIKLNKISPSVSRKCDVCKVPKWNPWSSFWSPPKLSGCWDEMFHTYNTTFSRLSVVTLGCSHDPLVLPPYPPCFKITTRFDFSLRKSVTLSYTLAVFSHVWGPLSSVLEVRDFRMGSFVCLYVTFTFSLFWGKCHLRLNWTFLHPIGCSTSGLFLCHCLYSGHLNFWLYKMVSVSVILIYSVFFLCRYFVNVNAKNLQN